MNKKDIFGALIFMVVAAFLLGAAWLYRQHSDAALVRGQYVFANTRDNMQNLAHIRLITAGGETNIYKQDYDWRVKEAEDYFVNANRLTDFYEMINNSLIETVAPADEETKKEKQLNAESATKIITYNADDEVLDEIIIGKHYKGTSAYAYSPDNKKYYYVISNVGALSGKSENWLPYPLLSVDDYLISKIKTPKLDADHEQIRQLLAGSLEFKRAAEVLGFIGYDKIMRKSEFQNLQKEQQRRLEITMVGGLVYVLDIYHINYAYWLGITLKADKVSRKEVPPFVGANQKYFADWLFGLNKRQGETLFEM